MSSIIRTHLSRWDLRTIFLYNAKSADKEVSAKIFEDMYNNLTTQSLVIEGIPFAMFMLSIGEATLEECANTLPTIAVFREYPEQIRYSALNRTFRFTNPVNEQDFFLQCVYREDIDSRISLEKVNIFVLKPTKYGSDN